MPKIFFRKNILARFLGWDSVREMNREYIKNKKRKYKGRKN